MLTKYLQEYFTHSPYNGNDNFRRSRYVNIFYMKKKKCDK